MSNNKKVLVTGSAGFIGFHVAKFFLSKNWTVIGIDALTDYYDLQLKLDRHKILNNYKNFIKNEFNLENFELLKDTVLKFKPSIIIHLAAQAGVRYSKENPRAYLNSNIIGTFNILEVSTLYKLKHLLISSTSSVYGNNEVKPFKEVHKTDYPISFYASTKKSCEILSHSYSYSFNLPVTLFRFFTVYGPWGRPDMALFKFTDAILNRRKIEIYNFGKMERDFTYIDDIVKGIYKLINKIPSVNSKLKFFNDSLSKDAPHRIINIGNSNPVKLNHFVELIEKNLHLSAKKKFVKNQKGDVKSTWSDKQLMNSITKFNPKTELNDGIKKFIKWYKFYYKINV